jgi:hypothetical protein
MIGEMASVRKIAAWVVLTLAPLVLLQGQTAPPELLRQALERLPGVSLLDPPRDLAGGKSIQSDLTRLGFWSPWVAADLDHDGKPDVVAAVVERKPGQTLYGILAIHAAQQERAYWIVPLGPNDLSGVVAGGKFGDRVMPLYCLECDSNPWFRWSGDAYELELYNVGERVPLGSESTYEPLDVYAEPGLDSRVAANVDQCTKVKIVERRGTSHEMRWYLVELPQQPAIRAWVPASYTGFEAECP